MRTAVLLLRPLPLAAFGAICRDRRRNRREGHHAVTACSLMAAIGDIARFPSARHLVGYLGLDPRVAQSGPEPARHGRISKQGPGYARHVLVEAAWHLGRTIGPRLRPPLADAREAATALELMTGAERQRGRRHTVRVFAPRAQHEAERELAAQAESAYLRLMSDWQSRPTRVGAGATPGRVKTPTKRRGSAADL